MYKKETQLVETVTGQWLRFPNPFKAFGCLVEISNSLTLNIDPKTGLLHVYKKDAAGVYQPVGEVTISTHHQQIQCAIRHVPSAQRTQGAPAVERMPARQGETA